MCDKENIQLNLTEELSNKSSHQEILIEPLEIPLDTKPDQISWEIEPPFSSISIEMTNMDLQTERNSTSNHEMKKLENSIQRLWNSLW